MRPPSLHIGIAILLTGGLFIFWPGLYGGFIFDDFPNLVDDPDWKVTSADWDSLLRASMHGISSSTGRPLAMLSFGLNHLATGMDPFWFKLTNVSFHLINGVLVLALSRQLMGLAPSPVRAQKMGLYAAILIAFAWTVHPLQVSSVLYVVQRMELGAATGTLWALLAYVRGRRAQIEKEGNYGAWLALAAVGFLFGLGFKETALLTPGYMLLIEIFILRFRTISPNAPSSTMIGMYSVGGLVAAALYFAKVMPSVLAPESYMFRDFNVTQRLLTQLHALPVYLRQIVIPDPERQTFYYDNFPVSTGLLAPPETLIGCILISALLILCLTLRRRWPLASFGIAWFFVAHALTSNVVSLELLFEHRNYLAIFGILFAVTQLLSAATSNLRGSARRLYSLLLVAGLATLCALETRVWADPFGLALTLENRNPSSLRASYGLGTEMADRAGSDTQSPLFSLALSQFEYATTLPSRSPLPEQAIIIMLGQASEPVPPATWLRFREKLALGAAGPEQISAIYGVLACRVNGSCKLDDVQLYRTLLTALDANPNSATIHSLYANFAWSVMGDTELAVSMMEQAVQLAPADDRFRTNLANFRMAQTRAHSESAIGDVE